MIATEYFTPSFSSRFKSVAVLLGIVVWTWTHQFWFSPLVKSLDTCDSCATLNTTRFIAIYLSALPFLISLKFAHASHKIWKSGQNPHPNAWLLFRTRLHRGVRAKAAAYVFGAIAIAFALLPGIIAYKFGVSYIFCFVEDCGCSHSKDDAAQASQFNKKAYTCRAV